LYGGEESDSEANHKKTENGRRPGVKEKNLGSLANKAASEEEVEI